MMPSKSQTISSLKYIHVELNKNLVKANYAN